MVHTLLHRSLRTPSIVWDKESRLRLQLFDTPTIVFVLFRYHTVDHPSQEDHTYMSQLFH